MPSSLTMLLPSALGFSSSTCVGLRYGRDMAIAAFLTHGSHTSLLVVRFASRPGCAARICLGKPPTPLAPVFPFPAYAFRVSPSSVISRYRISAVCPSATAPALALGPDLPRADRLLWKPWIFGRKDSHLPLATHSGILSSMRSTLLRCFLPHQCSSTDVLRTSPGFGQCFSPGHFRRQDLSTSEMYTHSLNAWLLLANIPVVFKSHPFPLNNIILGP